LGKTIIEKIIAAHSREKVAAGNIVWMEIDLRTARDFAGANVVENYQREFDGKPLADAEKTLFTFDCVAPPNNIPYANNQQVCRLFARKLGIKLFDVNMGIGSHIDIDQGLCLPGFIAVGTDSHLNILGAIGAFGQGMGDRDIAFIFGTGKTWFEVPETMRMVIKGKLEYPATAKDLTLAIVKNLGSKGALGKAIEFYGEVIDNLSLDGRITLASMVTEMGGIIGIIPPNDEVIHYCQKRSGKKASGVYADKDARYCQSIEIDITGLKPQISLPHQPSNVVDVKEAEGKKIDSIFIGSCTNGRLEDFITAAEILKGKKIAPWVMAKAVPATREIYGELLKKGILETLFDAGIIISHSACGGCASGQLGMTGKDEVQLSTGNRNFAGKQGAGETYLVSPATAAASALEGKITSPK
jgi:3-isopropylmalate/(R)-2-methylmalate dehydratase large subunit